MRGAAARADAERILPAALAEVFPRPGQDLPPGWRWAVLKAIAGHKTGLWGPEASSHEQGVPVVRSTEIAGYRIDARSASVRRVSAKRLEDYILQEGDILVNKSSGSAHLVGWPALFEHPGDDRAYAFSNFMLRLRPNPGSLVPWFLLYYLHSPGARAFYLGAQATTSGLRNLRVREFLEVPVPLPTLAEQQHIVARLDALRARTRDLTETQDATDVELERLERSILDRAFRGEL